MVGIRKASKAEALKILGMYVTILCIIFLQYVTLQSSMFPSTTKLIRQGIYAGINFGIILAMNLALFLMIRRWKNTLILTGALTFIWAVANRYVYLFHGTPLFISTLLSAGTAFEVIGSYQLSIDSFITRVCLVFLLEIAAFTFFCLVSGEEKKAVWPQIAVSASALIADVVVVLLCLSGIISGIKKVSIGATWNAAVRDYGFLCCFVKDFQHVIDPISKPYGFDAVILRDISGNPEREFTPAEAPDIILILNETYFDLSVCASIVTDRDYMEPIKTIDGLRTGKALVPNIGGGTNNTEYELLTSNSMLLLNSEAPFNYLNFDENSNSIVRYLGRMGYTTYGMHYGKATNYSRNKVYPELGFDNISLGEENFLWRDFYGKRACLDSDNYRDLIEKYNEDTNGPKFLYLLTLQNHGGWQQNDSELDQIHCLSDYGDYTEQINEYLTSVYMSNIAFKELTEYYRDVDQPVIICMVGDHAPSFIGSVSSSDVKEEELSLYQRMVPYMIWNNFGAAVPEEIEFISIVDIVPILIETANLPLSPYYQAIRNLQKEIPLRTSYGAFVDREGRYGVFEEGCYGFDELSKYYAMEYNSIKGGRDYLQALFLP